MSRPKRTSALAGLVFVLALAVAPAARAAGPVLSFPASWLETGLDRIAGWWQEVTTPRHRAPNHIIEEKIGTGIDPDGAHSTAPPATNVSKDITGTIDPNG